MKRNGSQTQFIRLHREIVLFTKISLLARLAALLVSAGPAAERTDVWIKADFYGLRGWVSASHVTTQGNCG